jgi:hypothetical protein
MKYFIYLFSILFKIINTQDIPLGVKLEVNSKFNDYQANCFLFNKTSWQYYDINPISRSPSADTDYYITTDKGTTIYFNFCGETLNECNSSRSLLTVKYADGSCKSLKTSPNQRKFWNTRKLFLFNEKHKEDILSLTIHSDEICYRQTKYSLTFIIKCDRLMEYGEFKLDDSRINSFISFEKDTYFCEKSLHFASRHACSNVPIYSGWKFYMDYSYFFGCAMIIFGFYIILRGLSFKRVTSILYGINSGLLIFFYFLSLFNASFSDLIMWVLAIICISLGVFIGIMMNQHKRLRVIVVGGMSGYVLATICYYLFFAYLNMNIKMQALLMYSMVILIGFTLQALPSLLMKENTVFLVSNPICGSFTVLRVC